MNPCGPLDQLADTWAATPAPPGTTLVATRMVLAGHGWHYRHANTLDLAPALIDAARRFHP